jgi:1L-myo-inositol 1-phosphate cytidylyltransferase
MAIDTAVVLAAGLGSRLRDAALYKPLCPVAGSPLIDHAITRLAAAGIRRALVVLGYGAGPIAAHLEAGGWPLVVETVETPDYHAPNGVSALAAAPLLDGQAALLVMCDHIVDPALYALVARAGAGDGLRLGVDRRLEHPWVDPQDVTCVQTRDDAIVAIGKGLESYDCHDTGVFAAGPRLYEALASLANPSLTEGVRRLAAEGRARVVECGDLDWIDVDDAKALEAAEAWLEQG